MKLNAKLDVDVVAIEQEDDVTCLITLEAPVAQNHADRLGQTLIVVVDRSGSMQGERLAAVRSSLHSLVERVRAQDTFGIVSFDGHARIEVPTRKFNDHHAPTVHGLIESIQAGGSTDLSGGYLLGLSEARRHRSDAGSTVLLLSDGQANGGILDPVQLGQLAAKARMELITTGTIGIGAGYDESMLAEIATQGNGLHRFAYTADDATAVVLEEAGDLLSKSIVNAFVRVKPNSVKRLEGIGALHEVPRWVDTDHSGQKAVVFPIGDLYSGEKRELLVNFAVPAIATLGQQELAVLEIEYVTLPELETQVVTWPLSVNVVAGADAATRIADPSVRTAKLLAEVSRVKSQSTTLLSEGDIEGAADLIEGESKKLDYAIRGISGSDHEAFGLRARLNEERNQLLKLSRGVRERPTEMSRKSMMEDYVMQSRGRDDEVRRRRSRERRDF